MRELVVILVALTASFLCLSGVSAQDASSPPVGAPTLQPITVAASSGPTISGWQGCVDPNGGFRPITIGEPTTVCLVLSNSPDWATPMSYMRLNFQPIADDYSRFHVPNSYNQLIASQDNALSNTFPGNITVHASSQTA